jgi:RNA polymerase sigma factor (sigma-70 family)
LADRGDDTGLVLAAIEGDADAFGVLFDRWFDRTFDVAFRIVRNRDTAAEVAQEAFLAAWQGLGKLEQPESFGGWLLRTSRNRALNRLDREKRAVALGNEETTMEIDRKQATTLDSQLEQDESAELVWTAAAAARLRVDDDTTIDVSIPALLPKVEVRRRVASASR